MGRRRPAHPALYQVNTRAWLHERCEAFGRHPRRLPDADLDRIVAEGFDWVRLLGVWQTGEAGPGRDLVLAPGHRQRAYEVSGD